MRKHERNDTQYWLDAFVEISGTFNTGLQKFAPKNSFDFKKDRTGQTLAEDLYQEEAGFNFSY